VAAVLDGTETGETTGFRGGSVTEEVLFRVREADPFLEGGLTQSSR
jgi:hypothetical protein